MPVCFANAFSFTPNSWLFGAGRVIVIDHLEYRLEFVQHYAQCEVYNFRSIGDPVLFLKKATD